jgi:uncharacterized protein YndB with AHSA1/START domain
LKDWGKPSLFSRYSSRKSLEYWTVPEHITKWNFASDDWKTSKEENDLRAGGKFVSRMEAKDGSQGFDFSVYIG